MFWVRQPLPSPMLSHRSSPVTSVQSLTGWASCIRKQGQSSHPEHITLRADPSIDSGQKEETNMLLRAAAFDFRLPILDWGKP